VAVVCLCFLFAAGMPAQNAKPAYTTFEAPDAGTGTGEGTLAAGINTAEVIAGRALPGTIEIALLVGGLWAEST